MFDLKLTRISPVELFVLYSGTACIFRAKYLPCVRSEREEETESQTKMNVIEDGLDERNMQGRSVFQVF